jgi:hypothetical protein
MMIKGGDAKKMDGRHIGVKKRAKKAYVHYFAPRAILTEILIVTM